MGNSEVPKYTPNSNSGAIYNELKTMDATLYRMVTDDRVCPFGLKAKNLLERRGFTVDDRHLTSRLETDAFQEEHGVETTPQVFIDGKRIGGYDMIDVPYSLGQEFS